jgi:hypothetical protein
MVWTGCMVNWEIWIIQNSLLRPPPVNVITHLHLVARLRMAGAVPPLPHNVVSCSDTALLLPIYATVLLKTRGGSVYWFSVKAGDLQIVDLTLEAHHDCCSTDYAFSSDANFRVPFFFKPLHVMLGHCLVRVRDCFVHCTENTRKCGSQSVLCRRLCVS